MFDPDFHEGIIFDDMEWRDKSREEQIAISDFEYPRSIKILYRTVRIPRNTPKIFCCNFPNEVFNLGDGAIRRRLTEFHAEITEGMEPPIHD